MDEHVGTELQPRVREDSAVQELLDRFARAVTSGDGEAVARLWETPALVLDDRTARTVGSPTEIEGFFSGAKERYNARGILDTRPEIERLEWLNDRIVAVLVRWPYLDERGQEVGEERSTYILRAGSDGRLKIRVAVMQGASAAG
jgi:ketosteroid isomerase-like protein